MAVLYWLVKGISAFTNAWPLGIRMGMGRLIGRLCLRLIPGWRKRMALENIGRSLNLDERAAEKVYEESTIRFGPMFLEMLELPGLKREVVDERLTFEGEEHLQAALQAGQGCVLATAHSGNWELLGAALALHGFPLVAVVQKQTNGDMDRFINEYRTRAGMHVTYKTGVRDMVRLLGEGKIIGLLMDQDSGRIENPVTFFGRVVPAPPGAAALARMKKTPIVPAFIVDKGNGCHHVIIHPPLMPQWSEERETDIQRVTQELTQIIETHIRAYPQDWFWLHNRWKHEIMQ
ncbi:lysophospholipid acyltransferase family protein [Azotosporobacter soli]|uniref:lysophospholipid acyltransferase family protein n=1 Tax=Azotosporobacter soli TaxID=3055040 RepID=UPI0031FE64E3